MKKRIIAMSLGMMFLFSACAASSTPNEQDSEQATLEYSETETLKRLPGDQMDIYSYDSESYLAIDENRTQNTEEEASVTFSLKVDTASYTNVARYIRSSQLPPTDAVKTEELLNYFSYENKLEDKQGAFYLSTEIGDSPYDKDKKIALIRVKTEDIQKEELPPSNLTFLIDTSGSMDAYDKLPLLKKAFALLVDTLDENDRVSIVTYAGSSEVILSGATGEDKFEIVSAINTLEAGGSTYGEGGIQTAYQLAEKNYIENGNNRIILATDGDFNVGVSSTRGLTSLISEKRDSGIKLSVLGFGMGNLKDDNMETLSKHGDGNYSYISSLEDAKKVLVDELGSTLFTVASDVKAQVEFNPASVSSYRLIGYENRMLNNEDFEDDTKDAGEIGAGTDVVMMFELKMKNTDDSKYKEELFEIKIRYKEPKESASKEVSQFAYKEDITQNKSTDFNFACAVVGFSHLLRESTALGELDIREIKEIAKQNQGSDVGGYRREFVKLIGEYEDLAGANDQL